MTDTRTIAHLITITIVGTILVAIFVHETIPDDTPYVVAVRVFILFTGAVMTYILMATHILAKRLWTIEGYQEFDHKTNFETMTKVKDSTQNLQYLIAELRRMQDTQRYILKIVQDTHDDTMSIKGILGDEPNTDPTEEEGQ